MKPYYANPAGWTDLNGVFHRPAFTSPKPPKLERAWCHDCNRLSFTRTSIGNRCLNPKCFRSTDR